jgi:hypothetical protein
LFASINNEKARESKNAEKRKKKPKVNKK